MTEHETRALLRGATDPLAPDVDRLVAGGLTRGRRARRRRTVATGVAAAAAVVAVAGGMAALGQVPGGRASEGPGYAGGGSPSASASASPAPSPSSPASSPASVDPMTMDALITVSATRIPQQVADLVPGVELGEIRDDLGVADERQRKTVHFLLDGTLTTVVIERADSLGSCQAQAESTGTCEQRDGHDLLTWGPDTSDGVTAQGASYWNHGFVVSVLSYNAADGKDAPIVTDAPVLTPEELVEVASSEVWFTP